MEIFCFRNSPILNCICEYLPFEDAVIFLSTLRITSCNFEVRVKAKLRPLFQNNEMINQGELVILPANIGYSPDLILTYRMIKAFGNDCLGSTAFLMAVGDQNVFQCPFTLENKKWALDLIKYGHLPTVKSLLLAKPEYLNQHNLQGETALCIASRYGHIEIVQFLLTFPNIKIDETVNHVHDWLNALDWSFAKKHYEITRLLLATSQYRTNPDIPGGAGRTALSAAVMSDQIDIINELLDRGANPNWVDQYERIPLYYAATSQKLENIKLLVRRGADINHRIVEQMTVLHWATSFSTVEVVLTLLECGADSKLVDRLGRTPLHCAQSNKKPEIMELLQNFEN